MIKTLQDSGALIYNVILNRENELSNLCGQIIKSIRLIRGYELLNNAHELVYFFSTSPGLRTLVLLCCLHYLKPALKLKIETINTSLTTGPFSTLDSKFTGQSSIRLKHQLEYISPPS